MSTFNLPQPKQVRARETVSLVVEAARRALKTAGESAVRIQEISSQTGVSIGSIYHHFGDREGLIRAAYIEQFTASVALDVEHLKKWTANIQSTDELREYFDDPLVTDVLINEGTDVWVEREESGRPVLRVAGRAREHADRLGVGAWHLSLTHTDHVAIAYVVLPYAMAFLLGFTNETLVNSIAAGTQCAAAQANRSNCRRGAISAAATASGSWSPP